MTDIIQKAIKLIAVYARVSTSTQEDQKTIQTQLLAVREFAQRNGYTIVQEYIDDGWSGDMLARPALDKLRQDAKEKIWDAVLIYDPDRLARRYSYQELLMDELREAGMEVVFVTISTPKNSEDKILYGVRGLFAEYERAKISERFRLGKLRKVKEGHILVSEALYGYRYIPKRDSIHGYYKINDDEAKVVKMMFAWVGKEGLTLRKVVRRLQELSIKPRKSKRGVWSTSTLSTLLRHKAYIGEAHWGSSYAVVPENPTNKEKYRRMKKSSRRIRPEEEWHIISVPAIIDRDLFLRARAQLETNFALCQRNRKNEYLLAGKIWCDCGKRRAGEGPMKGKHLYYRCSDRVNSFPLLPSCRLKGINARIADKLVWQKVSNLMSSPELLTEQANRWFNSQKNKPQISAGSIECIDIETKKLKDREERYNKAYGAELITLEQLRGYTVPIRERLTVLESQVMKVQQERNQAYTSSIPTQTEIQSFARRAVGALSNLNFEAKRAIVLNTVEKVVGDKEKLQVYGYIPVTNVGSFPSNRNSRSPECREVNIIQCADKKVRPRGELSVLHD
ncbi:MAG: recombinase family protein [bacterium]|nr:recombinase family protein [bacterium]